jgi:hypothetical protein
MFGILFLVLAVVAFASIFINLVMRIRLTQRRASDRIAWWRRGSDEIDATYHELFPKSYLPSITRYVFWLIVISAGITLLILLKRSH